MLEDSGGPKIFRETLGRGDPMGSLISLRANQGQRVGHSQQPKSVQITCWEFYVEYLAAASSKIMRDNFLFYRNYFRVK